MWKPIHNIYTEKTLLSEQRIFIMPLPLFKYTFECQTTKNLQACYCGLCNVVEYTQKGMGTKMIIYSLTIKFELQNFGKDPWEVENCTTTCTISFRGEHNFVWHSVVEGCKKEWSVSNISLAVKGGQMERWPLPGAAVGTSFCSMWWCPGQAGTGACHWSCLAALGASQKCSVALTTSCHLGSGPGWNRESKPCELDNASYAIVKLPSLMS